MAENTNIEWTDASWNPFTGCSRVSDGCTNCYMFRQWPRLKGMGVKGYEGEPDVPVFHEGRVDEPRHWKKPKLVFVCSMSDLFHESHTWAQLAAVFRTMVATPQHTYQVLTKRPGNMLRFAQKWGQYSSAYPTYTPDWPENVWAGVSVESQDYASRLHTLTRVPAEVHFVSCEPLLGPLDLTPWLPGWNPYGSTHESPQGVERYDIDGSLVNALDWVICGGESGPNARPAHPDWIRSLRDQCQEAGVPYFFKQWGEWLPDDHCTDEQWRKARERYGQEFLADRLGEGPGALSVNVLQRWAFVGKKAAGALLDGREWREMPA